MKIRLHEVLENSKYWLQKIHIWEFDPKIIIENKKYELVGIHSGERVSKPYLTYKRFDSKGDARYESRTYNTFCAS